MTNFADRTLFLQHLAILLVISLLFTVGANAGKDSGGGGGEVHDKFIAAGHRVIHYLSQTPRGHAITEEFGLNLCRLKATLTEGLVFVYDDSKGMTDDRDSAINATGFKWRIHIGENYWLNAFNNNSDIYHLVLKEMLRSEQTHFDNALDISILLLPFPRELFIDKELPIGGANINTNQCLSESEQLEIYRVKSDYQLYSQATMPQCQPDDLTSASMYSSFSAADDLLHLIGKTKCQVTASECRVFEGKSIIQDSVAVKAKSIQWKGRNLFTIPVYKNGDGFLADNDNDRLTQMFEFKKRQLREAGICNFNSQPEPN